MAKAPKDPAPETPPPETSAPETPASERAKPDWVKVGVGVGSAALVAALLYATRSKTKDWTK